MTEEGSNLENFIQENNVLDPDALASIEAVSYQLLREKVVDFLDTLNDQKLEFWNYVLD
tara:strand:+ start:310 stop:486 length:177 start_codon:yes stop_codon:yes gene_type:complete